MKPGTDADFDRAVRGALLAHTCPATFWEIVERRDGEGDVLPALNLAGLAWRFLPWVLGALLLLGAWGYLERLQKSRDAALLGQQATAQALAVESRARLAVTDALVRSEAALAEREAVRQRLARELTHTRGQLDDALQTDDVRPWAVTRVPAGIVERLRAAAGHSDGGRHDSPAAGAAHTD